MSSELRAGILPLPAARADADALDKLPPHNLGRVPTRLGCWNLASGSTRRNPQGQTNEQVVSGLFA